MNKIVNKLIFLLLIMVLLLFTCKDINEQLPDTGDNTIGGMSVYCMGNVPQTSEIGKYVVQPDKAALKDFTRNYILLLDGYYAADNKFLKDVILHGNPLVVIGNTRTGKNLFEEQFNTGVTGGRTPDGNPLTETLYCYWKGDVLSNIFITTELNPGKAVDLALEWIKQILEERKMINKEGNRAAVSQFNQYFQRDWSSGDSWKPFGKMNIRTIISRLDNDNNTSYDWYNIQFQHQSVPGSGSALKWADGWNTSDMYTWVDANYYNSSNMLVTYSPTTTSGTSSVGVEVGVEANQDGASVSASMNWSYSVSDVMVNDNSDFNNEVASWWHDVNEATSSGTNTLLIEPGACIRVPNGTRSWKEHYGIKYARYYCDWWIFGCGYHYSTEGSVEF